MGLLDEQEDEEDQVVGSRSWKSQLLKPTTLLLILILLFAYVMQGRMGSVTYDKAQFIAFAVLIGVMMFKLTDTYLKHKTAKIVFHGGFSTTRGRRDVVGNYGVYSLGDIRFGIEVKGRDGTLVAPITASTKVGNSWVLMARVEIVDPLELPPDVMVHCKQNNYKPPYFMGYADEEQYLDVIKDLTTEELKELNLPQKPTIAYLITEAKEANKTINMFKNLANMKTGSIEEFMETVKRLSKRDRSLSERIGSRLIQKDKSGDQYES